MATSSWDRSSDKLYKIKIACTKSVLKYAVSLQLEMCLLRMLGFPFQDLRWSCTFESVLARVAKERGISMVEVEE
jgi:hypothetical protein